MNKMLLGILALSSVSALADSTFHGYVNSNTEAKAVSSESTLNSEKKLENSLELASTSLVSKNRIGAFMHKDAKLGVFVGSKLDLKKAINEQSNFYYGARVDSEIVDGYRIALTYGQKEGYLKNVTKLDKTVVTVEDEKVLEDAIVKHLKAQNRFNEALYSDSDTKEEYLKDEGYRLFDEDKLNDLSNKYEANNTTLLSGVLSGKIGNFESRIGGIYNSERFADGTHRLNSFVKTEGKFNNSAKLSASLDHILTSPNYDYYGEADGKVKLEFDLSKDANFTTSLRAQVDNIKGKVSVANKAIEEHTGLVEFKNTLKYNGFANNEITVNGNYKAEIDHNPIVAGQTIEKDGISFTGDLGTITHKPLVKVALVNKSFNNLKLNAAVKDNLVITNYLGKATKNNVAVAEGKVRENTLRVYTGAEYKFNDKLTLNLDGNYRLDTKLNASKDANTHSVLVGPSLTYKSDNFNTENHFRYLGVISSENNTPVYNHSLFGLSKNSTKHNLTKDLTLETKLNVANYFQFDSNEKNDLLAVEPGVKLTYKNNGYTVSGDVNGSYGLIYLSANNKNKNWNGYYQGAVVNGNLELKKEVSNNAELVFGLNNKYVLNGYVVGFGDPKFGDSIVDYVANYSQVDSDQDYYVYADYLKEYSAVKQDPIYKFINQGDVTKIRTEEEHKSYGLKHAYKLTPSLGAVLKYNDGKLTITPKVLAEVVFDNSLNKDIFGFKNVTGKAVLNVDYAW